MSVEAFKAQAKRLADHLTQKHGVKLKHAALLEAVAAMHGARDWNTLAASDKPTFTKRFISALKPVTAISMVLDFDELLYAPAGDGLRLGLTSDRKAYVNITNQTALSHLLILGPTGQGGRLLLENLLVQQVLRGGGVLIIDSMQDLHLQRKLKAASRHVGREEGYRTLIPELSTNADEDCLADALVTKQVVHASPGGFDSDANAHGARMFQAFWKYAEDAWAKGLPSEIPYLVVLPRGFVTQPFSSSVFSRARAMGISLVLHEESLPALEADSADADIVLGNTFTKIFFNPTTTQALNEAVRYIEAQVDGTSDGFVREVLSKLGTGQALVLNGRALQEIRLLVVLDSVGIED